MVKLIYDSAITGHHSEYISHLVKHLSKFHSEDVYYFVVSEELKIAFPEIISESEGCSSVVWEFIPQSVIKKIHDLSLLKRSFAELELVEQYASKFSVNEVFLLYFNIFQLALIFKRPSPKLKGILFLQFLRMEKATLKDKLKYYRKYLITKFYSRNPKITSVFILNDQKTVDYLNNEFRTDIFKMLPDPIPVYDEDNDFQIYDYYNIPKNKKVLLHPGSIDPRKGTYEIIDSVDFLNDKETEEYAILIVGRAKLDIENVIREKLSALQNINFTIVFDNTFVSNERLKSLFLQSYAVLMPYKNAEASSGIMGHASIVNKCVLAPDSGLIGELIKKYKLGVLINKPISIEIARGIERLGEYSNDEALSVEFASQHTVEVFSTSLLN
ncbi:glycosyltransferase [Flavobacterium gyeonganense]|uniref:Glycosyltransferase n=1 Tax=Flavobacterium gyeonganense TaxID=1310418 RepID=A0ABV5HGV3_9FLAO|nr:glycosyltransferase [Flavobacterium gyeonganense]